MGYTTEKDARLTIVEAGKVLYDQGYVVSNDGNISVRISEDCIVVTPRGVSKGSMNVDDMVVMDLDGNVISQGLRGPSSEVKMHLRVYREDSSVNAVVHAHPIYATSFAIAGIALDQPIMSKRFCKSAPFRLLIMQSPVLRRCRKVLPLTLRTGRRCCWQTTGPLPGVRTLSRLCRGWRSSKTMRV